MSKAKDKVAEQFKEFHHQLHEFSWMVDWKKLGLPYCHVYVVGTSEKQPCKIGIAVNGAKRLAGIQTGNPAQLFVHKSAWARSISDARAVEKFSHSSVSAKRLVGEWFDIDADEAIDLVEWSARELGIELSREIPLGSRDEVFDEIRSRLDGVGPFDLDLRHEIRAAKFKELGISLDTIKAVRATEYGF